MPDSNSPRNAPGANDLFAANKAINTRSMAPGAGFPIVPGYRPSGKMGTWALPLLLLSLVIVPALSALLFEKLWHFGNFFLFSELILGAMVGAMLFPAVHFGKIRNPVLLGVWGALLGILTFGSAMALEAWQFRPQYIASESAYIAQKYHLSAAKAQAAAEDFYSPLNTEKFYWLDRAQAGLTLSSSSNYSSRTASVSQFSGTAFWVIEAIELVLMASIAALVARKMADRRFSEEFNRWYLVKKFGAIHPLHVAPLLAAAQAGDFAQARQFAGSHREKNQNGAQLTAAYLPEKAGGIISLKAATGTKKGVQPIFEQEVSNEQMKALWPEFPMPNPQNSPFSS